MLNYTAESRFVKPESYWVGFTELRDSEVLRYLKDSGNEDFWQSVQAARDSGVTSAEILCSMFAKLCYKSLSEGKNANITRVRDIPGNIRGCFDVGHGSIFEHVGFNFITADCSRIFTHELVRHRAGTAFSQNSGRYIRLEDIQLVWDPILEGCEDLFLSALQKIDETIYLAECRKGLRVPPANFQKVPEDVCLDNGTNNLRYAHVQWPFIDDSREIYRWVPVEDKAFNFARKKKLTSAIRRIAPNGQPNEIGYTVNLRALRHTIMLRTSRHSEWEIRAVFAQLYNLLKDQYPLIFHEAREEVVDGLVEVTGMKTQPYEKTAELLLSELSDEQLEIELARRRSK